MTIRKTRRIVFGVALASSILFPAAVVAIPLGFALGAKIVGFIGIALTAYCFYGVPLWWVRFGTLRPLVLLETQVKKEGVRSVSAMAKSSGRLEKAVENDLRYLIERGALSGYLLLDGKLVTAKEAQETRAATRSSQDVAVQCPYCGGKSEQPNGEGSCPYCGARITPDAEHL